MRSNGSSLDTTASKLKCVSILEYIFLLFCAVEAFFFNWRKVIPHICFNLLSWLTSGSLSGSSVARCHACSKMMPTFFKLCNEYSNPLFVYADVEKCATSTSDVRYTPTFRFYRDGEKVDEFYGAGAQRLRDRVWLQS